MDWFELHSGFILKLQESGDSEQTTFTPHKRNEWLNKAMFGVLDEMFIPNPSGIGYSDNILVAELLQSLESYYSRPLYSFDDRSVQGFFPQDFYRTVGIRLKSSPYCSGLSTSTTNDTFNYWVVKLKDYDDLTATTVSEKLAKFNIACEVYNASNVLVGDRDIFRMSNILPDGYSEAELYILIQRYILQYGGNSEFGVEVYYERFANLYERGSFIIVQKPVSPIQFNLLNLKVTYTDTLGLDDIVSVEKRTMVLSRQTLPSSTRWIDNVRFSDSEFEGRSNDDPYNKSTKKSPYVIISGNRFLAYHYNLFNLFEFNLKYLRTPKLIDHEANQGLDLGLSYGNTRLISEMIIDKAVKLAAISTRSEIVNLIQ